MFLDDCFTLPDNQTNGRQTAGRSADDLHSIEKYFTVQSSEKTHGKK